MKTRLILVGVTFLIIASLFSGLYSGYAITSQSSQNQGTYSLTLVVTNVSSSNSSLAKQDVFFVLANGNLTSSAVIKVPFGELVRITIINHDSGLDPLLSSSYSNVKGTLNSQINVFSGTSVSQGKIVSGEGGTNYSSVPARMISHTFSTTSGLNIPIFPNSTEVGYTYFNNAGTYSWACMCNCGPFSMNTPGWMMGQLVVLPP